MGQILHRSAKTTAGVDSTACCHAVLKSRKYACLFSILFRDLTALSLHLNPGLLHIKPGRSAKVCPGYKYRNDTNLLACIGFCPGFEYKHLD
jgi:hypothetical protein